MNTAQKNPRLEIIRWFIPLAIITLFAGGIRLLGLKHGLPRYIIGRDEVDYHHWVTHYRHTGELSGTAWDGYPPALFVLLLGEEWLVDSILGPARQVGDYFLVARWVNVGFGALTVLLTGLVARRISGSQLAGLLATLLIATQVDFIEESRLGTANPPWIFFTVLSLWLLLLARNPFNYKLLFAAFVAGALSMLFKYQTAPLLILPFLIMLRHDWANRRRLLMNVALFGGLLALLLGWLWFGYGATEIVNTPGSGTAAIIGRANPLKIISLKDNILLIFSAIGGAPVCILIVAGFLAAFWLRPTLTFDWEGLSLLALFVAAFFWIMSLFWVVAIVKWLPVLNISLLLSALSMAALANSIITVVKKARGLPSSLAWGVAGLSVVGLAGFLIWPQVERYWLTLPQITRPLPAVMSMDWLYANAPQGARVVGNQPLFYAGSGFTRPPQFHSAYVSPFDDTVDGFRARGYEYLIVETTEDLLAQPRNAELREQAEQVAAFTGDAYAEPGQIIYRLTPQQQYVRYLWFGAQNEISFRGFDLSRRTITPGAMLTLTLYWMSVKPTSANNIVFVHVWNEATQTLIAQKDNPPNYGNSPTWAWVGDMQFISDNYQIAIPAEAQPGTYLIRIGMYDADTHRRLPISEVDGTPVGDVLDLIRIVIQS